jgi:hypothetical protein
MRHYTSYSCIATKVECMLADQLDVNWRAYDREVSSK